MNDYKTLSLALCCLLIENKSVTLVTADMDHVASFTILLETIAHDLVLKHLVLSSLQKDDKKSLAQGRKLTRYINLSEYRSEFNGVLNDLINDDWKGNCPVFAIKYWDQKQRKYRPVVGIAINKVLREQLLHNHGNLACPTAANTEYGSWLTMMYWWPPTSVHQGPYFKVRFFQKKIISKKSYYIDSITHDARCKYRRDDQGGRLRGYSNFRIQVDTAV